MDESKQAGHNDRNGTPSNAKNGTTAVLATRISAQEACRRLMMPPHVLRSLCDEYADFISLHRQDGKTYLDVLGFSRLQLISFWRNEGISADEIRRRLCETAHHPQRDAVKAEADAPAAQPDLTSAAGSGGSLEAAIARLNELLAETERKRMEDRDRLLTALMRTQQEIQQLRHELSARQVRKEKRRGLFRFLG